MYVGPYLITKILRPSNAVLQKSKRSRPFVVHFDKLKLFHGTPPTGWSLTTSRDDNALEHDIEDRQDHRVFDQPAADADCREYDDDRDVIPAEHGASGHGDDGDNDTVDPPSRVHHKLDSDVGAGSIGQPLGNRPVPAGAVPRSNQRPSRVRRQPRKMDDYVMKTCARH